MKIKVGKWALYPVFQPRNLGAGEGFRAGAGARAFPYPARVGFL